MVEVRKSNLLWCMVSLKSLETGYEKLFTYYRILDQEKYLFVLNFSAEKINLSLEILPTGSNRIMEIMNKQYPELFNPGRQTPIKYE